MFRFNPYNFTITIDEAIQPPGIPIDYVQMRNPAGRRAWVPPGTDFAPDNPDRILAPGGGPGSGKDFKELSDEQQAPMRDRVRAAINANKEVRYSAGNGFLAQVATARAIKKNRLPSGSPPLPPPPTGGGSPPPPPPPPTGGGSPPPPTGTSTGISARRQKANDVIGSISNALSGAENAYASKHPNRRANQYGGAGRMLQSVYNVGTSIYDAMKTPGTPGSPATATTPAVAATPGKFDPRAGGRMVRAGAGAIAGTMVAGPIGGLLGAGIGALTARRKPIPEERYYRVYKMISQHDHR